MTFPFLVGGERFCTKRKSSPRCVYAKPGEAPNPDCEINPASGRCRKRKKTTEEKKQAYQPGADEFLNDKKQSWCRCVLHVAKKQTNECLKDRLFKKQAKCYNPYAICSKSTKTSTGGKPCAYDFLTVPDVQEVEKYLYLNFKAYQTFCEETGRTMFPKSEILLRENADAFYRRNDDDNESKVAPPTPQRPPKKKVDREEEEGEKIVWLMRETKAGVLEEVDSKPTFLLKDVRGDGNCFHYAFLRATKSKNLEPGKGFDFDPDEQKLTKKTGLIDPPRSAMRQLKKMFSKSGIQDSLDRCEALRENFELAGFTVKEISDNLTKNKEYIEYVPGVHDLLFHCLFGVKLRVYHEGLDRWQGAFEEEDPAANDVVNVLFQPETEDDDGHYLWLKPLVTSNPKKKKTELNGGQRTEKAMRELAVLEEAYREPFLKTSTEGSTYQTEDGAFFVKFLTPRQLAYYNTNEPMIRQFHAPYRLVKDRLEREAFGRPIFKSNQKGIRFALQALETMHANQTFHGDVFSTDLGRSDVHVNVGNILQDDSGTFRLIDFGPLRRT